jgi:peptidoglycan/LPS O-acetylase OafA/YrhL
MSTYRLYSMFFYGAAAVLGTIAMVFPSVPALFAVVVPLAAAAAADRFINRNAEPDDRMRSFTIYALGALAGLLAILFFGGRLGGSASAVPIVAFGVAALIDFLMPPAEYQPRDPHRYGASPPVTMRD